MDDIFICSKCNLPLPLGAFYVNRTNGHEYRRKTCRKCEDKMRKDRGFKTPEKNEKLKKRVNEAAKRWRIKPENRGSVIVTDARRSDIRNGFITDIDKEWVTKEISKGCSYCGETRLVMTLDRINNSLGHLKSNLVSACERCNYLRRDMPHEAWMALVPAIKKITLEGLFGNWTCAGNRVRRNC